MEALAYLISLATERKYSTSIYLIITSLIGLGVFFIFDSAISLLITIIIFGNNIGILYYYVRNKEFNFLFVPLTIVMLVLSYPLLSLFDDKVAMTFLLLISISFLLYFFFTLKMNRIMLTTGDMGGFDESDFLEPGEELHMVSFSEEDRKNLTKEELYKKYGLNPPMSDEEQKEFKANVYKMKEDKLNKS